MILALMLFITPCHANLWDYPINDDGVNKWSLRSGHVFESSLVSIYAQSDDDSDGENRYYEVEFCDGDCTENDDMDSCVYYADEDWSCPCQNEGIENDNGMICDAKYTGDADYKQYLFSKEAIEYGDVITDSGDVIPCHELCDEDSEEDCKNECD